MCLKFIVALKHRIKWLIAIFVSSSENGWTDHSGECSGSPAPGLSYAVSRRAPHNDPPCWLSGKIKEHVLEAIIHTQL